MPAMAMPLPPSVPPDLPILLIAKMPKSSAGRPVKQPQTTLTKPSTKLVIALPEVAVGGIGIDIGNGCWTGIGGGAGAPIG